MLNLCEHFKILPRAGGLEDQDAEIMDAFEMILEARAIRYELDNPTKKK